MERGSKEAKVAAREVKASQDSAVGVEERGNGWQRVADDSDATGRKQPIHSKGKKVGGA